MLLVFANHASGSLFAISSTDPVAKLFYHMNVGVTVFFLVSGFLLYRPFVAHRTGGPASPHLLAYARRRALRIFPAYWLCLTILVLIPGAVVLSTTDLVGQYALLETLPIFGAGSCVSNFGTCELAHTWSLAVELTFYAMLPLYVIAADRLARGRSTAHWVGLELLLLAALSGAAMFAKFVLVGGDSTSIMGGTAIGFTLWFAIGMGLAVLSVAQAASPRENRLVSIIRRRSGLIWLAAIGVYVALSQYLPPTPFIFDRSEQVVTFLAFGLFAVLILLPAAFGGEGGGLPRRFLANRLVGWIGLISYGIFLWHNVVLLEVTRRIGSPDTIPAVLAILAVSIAIAAASYYLVERPVLRYKNRPFMRRHPPAVPVTRP